MRALFLTFAAVSLLAQNHDVDIQSFIKSNTEAGTVIQDPEAPVSFQLAPGWHLADGMRWGDHETTLWFVENGSEERTALYYQYPLQQQTSGDPYAALEQAMMDKVNQRVEREHIADYHIRPGSVQKRQIGGQPALSFIAEFSGQGESRVEYMVRVLSKNTKAHFFIMGLPANANIDAISSRLEPIVNSLRIP